MFVGVIFRYEAVQFFVFRKLFYVFFFFYLKFYLPVNIVAGTYINLVKFYRLFIS